MAAADEQSTDRSRRRTTVAVVVVLLAVLAAAAVASLYLWRGVGETEIGTHGLIALGLGIAVTVLLGAGLTTLLIVSNRRGFDERAGRD